MLYVGLDVHKRFWSCCVLDERLRKRAAVVLPGEVDALVRFLEHLGERYSICFEASSQYGYLYDRLRPHAERVAVAHPAHVRLIYRSKRKNDRLDAQKLAKLLAIGAIPMVHVPSGEIRALRSAVVARERLVGECTRCKNAIRALLEANGIRPPKRLWSKQGRRWLADVELAHELYAERRDLLLEALEQAMARLKRLERSLNKRSGRLPAVALLRTIPGVGVRTAEALVAFIADPRRFTSNKTIGSYFGLVPKEDSSGGCQRLGHITKNGPSVVRRLLNQAAWQAIRRSPQLRSFYEKIRRGKKERRKIAIVATMHRLARVALAMLRSGEAWRWQEA